MSQHAVLLVIISLDNKVTLFERVCLSFILEAVNKARTKYSMAMHFRPVNDCRNAALIHGVELYSLRICDAELVSWRSRAHISQKHFDIVRIVGSGC